MFTTKTSTELLKLRLDAEHYSPSAIANERTLRAFGVTRLRDLIDVNESGYGSLPDSADYCGIEEGIPLIRGGDLSFGAIKRPEAYVPAKYHKKKSAFRPGDVLFLIKGACIDGPEGVALVPASLTHAIFNGSCFRARCTQVDSGFLVAYSLTRNFLIQKAREIANTGISYNSEESIHGFLVPSIQAQVQEYIGDKVRQAERLREIAAENNGKITRGSTTLEIDEALKFKESKSNRTSSNRINPGRLDSKYYALKEEEVLRVCTLQSECSIANLNPEVSNGFEERDFVEDGLSYITVSELASGRLDLSNSPKINASTFVPTKAKIDPRCVLVARSGSIGTAVKVHQRHSHAVISSHLIRLRFENEFQAIAVAAFLNSSAGKSLMWKISYGAVQSQIGQDELLSLPVPTVVIQNQNQLLEWWNQRESSIENAQSLVSAAKILVQALIERKVTEVALIHAQTCLERGDDKADRAILSRLFEGGLDATETRQLFPDLDAYYENLRLVEREQTEVAAK